MGNWAEMVVEAAAQRAAERARAKEESGSRVLAEEAALPAEAEQEAADREARETKQREQYEGIAARVQRQVRARRSARAPMTEWERQTAGQALGEGWDNWEGPPPAA
ncbi:hypothetical protein [Streptomyces sp. NBC_00258]|uniref:hypothetical protein n=1 Tax=Streptomyces sp. NBC_00258 TaxID=2903642 RepID=UPI002E294C00|nr:hypothetical protein [Streptomyces sp. NBC_00258]